MYNIDFIICSIFIVLVEIIMFYSNRSMKNTQNKIYITMIFSLLITSICDIISAIASNSNGQMSRWFTIISNYIYFPVHDLLPMLFAIYNIVMISRAYKKYKLLKVLFFIPYAFAIILILLNPFTKAIFYVTKEGMYTRGPLMGLLYIEAISYFIFTIIYVTKYRKLIPRYRRICIYTFIGAICVPILIQYMYHNLLLESFGEALCFLLIYVSIQRKDDLIDSVTGTYNKKAFVDYANTKFQLNMPFSVISVSIDGHEYLEKIFGVNIMSKLEKRFCNYIKKFNPNYDIYHISDYMFYFVADRFDNNILTELANNLFLQCDKNWVIGEIEIPVDVDICVINCPEDVSGIDQLFECSMYISHEQHGRESRIVYANELSSFYGKRKSQIKHAINKALKNNTLEVFYQPIFSTSKQRVNSAEALVRLFDTELGFISPEEFIPIAEEDGSILAIGNYVLENVCKFIRENNIKSIGIEYIEVNISVIECVKQDMSSRVLDLITKYNISPSQINLEITETAAVNSPEQLRINMSSLVNKGVYFSLDDYGSGYSNINYLIELPFRLIKVDKSIVWSSFKNEKAGIALESSISLIRKLEFNIVAEGVETKEQAEKLQKMGCEYLQGYYFSKPLCKEDFIKYITAANG